MNDLGLARIRSAVADRTAALGELLSSFVAVASENPPGVRLKDGQEWLIERLDSFAIPFEV